MYLKYSSRVLKKIEIELAFDSVVRLSLLKVISRISSYTVTVNTCFQYSRSVFAAVCNVSYLLLSFPVRRLQAPNSVLTSDFSNRSMHLSHV